MATKSKRTKKTAKKVVRVSDLRARKTVKGGLKIPIDDPPPPKK